MANVTRINLTDKYAVAVEVAAKQAGVSQAEVVRQGLRALWGENLENAPVEPVASSTVQRVNRSTVHPVKAILPSADELFSCGA